MSNCCFTLLFLVAVAPLSAGEGLPKPIQTKPGQTAHYVKVSASASKPDPSGKQLVTINLEIDSKIFLIANPPGNDDFDLDMTTLRIEVEGEKIESKVHYPPGEKLKVDGLFQLQIYQKKAVITATVHRKPGDTRPLVAVTSMHGSQFVHRG